MGCSAIISPTRGPVPHAAPIKGQGQSNWKASLGQVRSYYNDSGNALLDGAEVPMKWAGQHESPCSPSSSSSSASNVVNTPGDCNMSCNLVQTAPIDEMWQEIAQQEAEHGSMKLDGQTLQDFLVRTGAKYLDGQNHSIGFGNDAETSILDPHRLVAPIDGSNGVIERGIVAPEQQQLDWLQQQQEQLHPMTAQNQAHLQAVSVFGSAMPMFVNTVNTCFRESHQMQLQLMPAVPINISRPNFLESQATVSEDSAKGLPGTMDKSVERKQKRMIKNRESAARSRAKKQAYITELEAKVKRLKEENSQLEKEKKNMMTFNPDSTVIPDKYQLRRTRSAPERLIKHTAVLPWL